MRNGPLNPPPPQFSMASCIKQSTFPQGYRGHSEPTIDDPRARFSNARPPPGGEQKGEKFFDILLNGGFSSHYYIMLALPYFNHGARILDIFDFISSSMKMNHHEKEPFPLVHNNPTPRSCKTVLLIFVKPVVECRDGDTSTSSTQMRVRM